MGIGKLRQRISVQTQTEAKDTYGADVPTWTTAATVWGSIQPISGREPWIAAQVHPDVSHLVTIRWYPGLGPQHRLVYQTRIFHILSVLTPNEIHSVSNEMLVAVQEEIGYTYSPPAASALFVAANSSFLNRVSSALLSPGAAGFAYSWWINLTSLPGTPGTNTTILSKWYGTGNQREYRVIVLNNAGTVVFEGVISPDGSSTAVVNSGVALAAGTWVHGLFSFGDNGDGNNHGLRIYVNGANKVFASQGGNVFVGNADFELGSINNGALNYLDGALARVGYWNYAPTDADVLAIYNAGKSQLYSQLTTAQQAKLTAYWNLTETAGTTRLDSTANHLDLTDHAAVSQDGSPP